MSIHYPFERILSFGPALGSSLFPGSGPLLTLQVLSFRYRPQILILLRLEPFPYDICIISPPIPHRSHFLIRALIFDSFLTFAVTRPLFLDTKIHWFPFPPLRSGFRVPFLISKALGAADTPRFPQLFSPHFSRNCVAPARAMPTLGPCPYRRVHISSTSVNLYRLPYFLFSLFHIDGYAGSDD